MKRILSWLLAIVMIFTIIPVAAFAEGEPTISFETTFTESMTVGDTFQVTASLANNPGVASFTVSLKWNEDVIKFTGFEKVYDEDLEEDVLVTDVFKTVWEPVYNDVLGIITAARAKDTKKEGTLFVANFEVVGSGELEIGLKDADITEFQMKPAEGDNLEVTFDYTNIEGLTVAGSGDEGVTIPEGAPFTAVTTDAGAILAIEQQDDVNGVPYYIVTIPEDANEAYVTAPDQVVMEDWNTGAMQATAYAFNIENGWEQLYISYDYVEGTEDCPEVIIPMNMVASDWSGEVELCFVEDEDGYLTHAFGIEDASYACLGVISFRYGEADPDPDEPTAYSITVQQPTGGTITVVDEAGNEITEAAAGEYVGVQYQAAEGFKFKNILVNGEAVITENGFFQMPAENVTVTAVFESTVKGYHFATSADVTAENGGLAKVHVKITGHSNGITSYNAYDLTLTFDSDKLELAGYEGAVKSDNGSVTVSGNTIRIVGCGADKEFGTDVATLIFQTKAEGAANVTIGKVQVSEKNESVKEDAPEATPKHDENDTTTEGDTTPDQSVVVVPYTVTKPGFVSGNDKVLHGQSYTFSYTDTDNYTYSGLKVTVDGTEVMPSESNGVYTVANVTGAVVITATQTANSYDVTKPENVTGPDKATYGTDYVFTVSPSSEDMAIDTVSVSDAAGNEIPYTVNENGEYVINGTDITGAFTINVTEKDKMTTITFVGIEATEIEGGQLTQAAEIGKEFTFKLIKEAAYAYTVKVGDTELSESTTTAGQYTIPANLVVQDGVTVTVTKTDTSKPVVEVTEYFNLDGKTMFLVTAKWRDKVLSYGENTMFWSGRYTVTGYDEAGAYCWLVASTEEMNTVELVKAAAEVVIAEAAEGETAVAIAYDFDVNRTTVVDINDAQLVYDMYNASYDQFTDDLPMRKFLEADVETDMELTTQDVAAIINVIVSGAMAA